MKCRELIDELRKCDGEAEVILVVYTEESYESSYLEKVWDKAKYNSVTHKRLDDDEVIVELSSSTSKG